MNELGLACLGPQDLCASFKFGGNCVGQVEGVVGAQHVQHYIDGNHGQPGKAVAPEHRGVTCSEIVNLVVQSLLHGRQQLCQCPFMGLTEQTQCEAACNDQLKHNGPPLEPAGQA